MKRIAYATLTLLFAMSLATAVFATKGENDKGKQCYNQTMAVGQLSCDDSKDKKDKDQE
jgi:hypothetical protein